MSTTENVIQVLDRDYRDPRGVVVHVTGYDREKLQEFSYELDTSMSVCARSGNSNSFFKRASS